MAQNDFFDAVKNQNIQLVQEMLTKGVDTNALNPDGEGWCTALYCSVKLGNFDISKLLVDNGADCNIGQLDFYGNRYCISTPIDFLCKDGKVSNDAILKYLLETRPTISENMINQRIFYCTQLFYSEKEKKMLFDYAASYFLRANIYDNLLQVENARQTMIAATANFNAYSPVISFDNHGSYQIEPEKFDKGGTHPLYFAFIIRTLFEQLVRYALDNNDSIIKSEKQREYIVRELRHNLETYNLLSNICKIPFDRCEEFYPAIIKNIITTLKRMKNEEEYTLPITWNFWEYIPTQPHPWQLKYQHAVCVNFVHICGQDSIAIRVDNLNIHQKYLHTWYKNRNKCLVLLPKIIRVIPLQELNNYQTYFEDLVKLMKEGNDKNADIEKLYDDPISEITDQHAELTEVVTEILTKKLKDQTDSLDCFTLQADGNCFVKSHEAGLAIRSNDSYIFHKILEIMRVDAAKLPTDISSKIDELNKALHSYWEKEKTIRFKAIREQYQKYHIERIMNPKKTFSFDQSYINLAIIKTEEQNEKEEKFCHPKDHDAMIHTYKDLYDSKTVIEVKEMFEVCKGQQKKILVFGRAGVGKTTFCRYIAHQWAIGKMWSCYNLVVLIPLRSLTNERYPQPLDRKKYSLIDLVEKEYYPNSILPKEDELFFKKQCDNGQVLWLLDGYDEFVQNHPKHLQNQLPCSQALFNELVGTQPHILTSRHYLNTLKYDVEMEITGFTDNNIEKYVTQFFDQIQTKLPNPSFESEKLLSFLQSNPSIWDAAHTPLILELICCVWGDTNWEMKDFTMTKLYDKITERLCRRSMEKQNINTQTEKEHIYNKQCHDELAFLESLAFNGMKDNKIYLSPPFPSTGATDLFMRVLYMGILKSVDNKAIGDDTEANKGHYFVHLSFQEHFAARYLTHALQGSPEQRQQAIEFIKSQKYNQRFLLVFTFASGLLIENESKHLDLFWKAILEEPLDLVGFRHIQLLISCAEETGIKTLNGPPAESISSIAQYIKDAVAESSKWSYCMCTQLQDSLRRSPSIARRQIIIDVLFELANNENRDTKLNVLPLVITVAAVNPLPLLVDLLVNVLRDEQVRYSAYTILKRMGDKAATDKVISAFVTPLLEGSESVKGSACEALGKMREKAATEKEVISVLVTELQEGSESVKESACEALGKMGERAAADKEVINALVNALQKGSESVKESACEALGNMGEKAATDEEVITALVTALLEESQSVKVSACEALWEMGKNVATDKEVDSALVTELQEGSESVKESACEALGNMGERAAADKEVINALVTELQEGSESVKESACEALGKIGERAAANKEVINALLTALLEGSQSVKVSACEALGKMGEKAATDKVISGLINALRTGSFDVRMSVGGALEKIGEKAAISDLFSMLDFDAFFKLSCCTDDWLNYLETVSADQLIKLFVKTTYDAWLLPLSKIILGEKNAVTISENRIVVYGNKEPVELYVTNSERCQRLIVAFKEELRKSYPLQFSKWFKSGG